MNEIMKATTVAIGMSTYKYRHEDLLLANEWKFLFEDED